MEISDWLMDIEQLATELPRLHINLFDQQDEESFHRLIAMLRASISKYDDLEIAMEIGKVIASCRDAHTVIVPPRMTLLPFECYWFAEGLYVTSALAGYESILHCRILAINGLPIEVVLARFAELVSHENREFFMAQLPAYLVSVEVLYGLRVVDSPKDIRLKLQAVTGEEFVVETPGLNAGELATMPVVPLVQDDLLPFYRRKPAQNYWKERLPEGKGIYFKYNRCKNMPGTSVGEFCDVLLTEIIEEKTANVVIDFRNNGGGDSTLLEAFIDGLADWQRRFDAGKLTVVVGRDTFSSALLNVYALQEKTPALFVGEATGGKPNCYGEVKYLKLNKSELLIRYSTKYYHLIDDDQQLSFLPDVVFTPKFADYLNRVDPCLDYILAARE